MKKSSVFNRIAVLFVAAMVTTGLRVSAETYKVDTGKSEVKWVGKKVTGSHNGTIQLKSGELMTTGKVLTGGSFVIDMTSIKDSDLTDAEYNEKLVGHLKSEDFFSVEKNPTSTFKITKVTSIAAATSGQPNYKLEGDLTIKGATHPATFTALVVVNGDSLNATAKDIKIDRTLYDIRYGSKKFFQSIGDKAIHDDFTLNVTLVAKKS